MVWAVDYCGDCVGRGLFCPLAKAHRSNSRRNSRGGPSEKHWRGRQPELQGAKVSAVNSLGNVVGKGEFGKVG
eukprot:359872-Chlamydomonas_euryale.AAC.3